MLFPCKALSKISDTWTLLQPSKGRRPRLLNLVSLDIIICNRALLIIPGRKLAMSKLGLRVELCVLLSPSLLSNLLPTAVGIIFLKGH